ncbi:TauD/TfdA family dioxygenase [Streptomyces sp. NPDC088350]|uniref:TauD/TfdA family dioxygenase n=1 Tax=Streptomyces sp. NPDC088350 TaxID=3365854 RepID=UPI0037FCDA6D
MSGETAWAPHEITPVDVGVDASSQGLYAYLRELPSLSELLIGNKAVVFRGFGVAPETLDPLLETILENRLPYVHGNSPRSKVGDNIYTSTEYPAALTISMHNELSYAAQWPARLLFYCEQAPESGGATPVVDGARWLSSIDPEVRQAFAEGVRYTQNLHDGVGLGKSWQDTFETDDRADVEAYLSGADATWQWTGDGLRISQTRPATTCHPVTGEEVWFSQFDQWHPAMLGDAAAAALARIMSPEELPQSTAFASGEPIPGEYATHVRDQGLASAVDVDWRTGDLLLIDNVLVGHGRRPYTGARRVLVAMS